MLVELDRRTLSILETAALGILWVSSQCEEAQVRVISSQLANAERLPSL